VTVKLLKLTLKPILRRILDKIHKPTFTENLKEMIPRRSNIQAATKKVSKKTPRKKRLSNLNSVSAILTSSRSF